MSNTTPVNIIKNNKSLPEGGSNNDLNTLQTRLTIDAKQAANYIGISYWSLLEMCKRGEIPYILVGNRKLFRTESLTSWLASRETVCTKPI